MLRPGFSSVSLRLCGFILFRRPELDSGPINGNRIRGWYGSQIKFGMTRGGYPAANIPLTASSTFCGSSRAMQGKRPSSGGKRQSPRQLRHGMS